MFFQQPADAPIVCLQRARCSFRVVYASLAKQWHHPIKEEGGQRWRRDSRKEHFNTNNSCRKWRQTQWTARKAQLQRWVWSGYGRERTEQCHSTAQNRTAVQMPWVLKGQKYNLLGEKRLIRMSTAHQVLLTQLEKPAFPIRVEERVCQVVAIILGYFEGFIFYAFKQILYRKRHTCKVFYQQIFLPTYH